MGPWLQMVLGLIAMLVGGLLLWMSWLPLTRTHRRVMVRGLSTAKSRVSGWLGGFAVTEDLEIPGAVAEMGETGSALPKLEAGKIKRLLKFENGVRGLPIPLFEYGRVNIDRWAGNIAENIYLRITQDPRGDVRAVMKKGLAGNYREIEEPRDLVPAGWIQVLVHQEMADKLKNDSGIRLDELAGKLTKAMGDYLKSWLKPDQLKQYRPKIKVYRFDRVAPTNYNLKFSPLLPGTDDPFLACDGAISFRPAGGKVAMPGMGNRLAKVAGQVLTGGGYVPLLENFAEEIVIGPHTWCHIHTNPRHFEATLTLGWRKSEKIGVIGDLEVREYEGKDPLFLEVPGYARAAFHHGNTLVRIPETRGPRTTCSLYRIRDEHEFLVATLTLANPLPHIDALPGVAAFDELDPFPEGPAGFARFIVSQIFLTTRFKKVHKTVLFLHDDEGRAFLQKEGFWDDVGVRDEAIVTAEDDLCYRLKLVVAPAMRRMLLEAHGNLALTLQLIGEITRIIQQEEVYRDLFDDQAKTLLKPSDNRPGLSLEISSDDLIPPGSVLLRALPILASVRRREIFGELLFHKWEGAEEISGMSCNSKRNFLIEYPLGTVMMRISRFPLYGIRAPRVNGAITINFEEPGQPGARLMVENRSRSNIKLEGATIPPDDDGIYPVPPGDARRVTLEVDGQRMEIRIYARPIQQMREPEFVPAPGKLSFFGLTLARREERIEWRKSPLDPLWRESLEDGGELEIKGASLVTENGYLASVVRNGVQHEVHFFSGAESHLKEAQDHLPLKLSAKDSTIKHGLPGLGLAATIWETAHPGRVVEYSRVDFHGNPRQTVNADILLEDFYDRFFDSVERLLPEGSLITDIDLLRCHPRSLKDFSRHLYLVRNQDEHAANQPGWLFHPEAGIRAVYPETGEMPLDLDYSRALVGPIDTSRGYRVDWSGESKTPLAFDIGGHREQLETYLIDGVLSLKNNGFYQSGGILNTSPKLFLAREDIFVSTNPIQLNFHAETVNPKNQLSFETRELSNFFDKDSYSIEYSAEARSFVVRSELHVHLGTTPKTVFLIVPSGKPPILGSHALPHVMIPPGQNLLVFPGLSFLFSQGPIYYGFNV